MNWLTNFIRPKIRSIVGQKEVPDNLWEKCPSCGGMLFHRDLAENLYVCHHCDHHLKMTVDERLANLFDGGNYSEPRLPKVPEDPLKFRDKKKYIDRLKDSQAKTGRQDAIVVAEGTVGGLPTVVAAFDFDFMGGSMGAGVGEGIVRAAEIAVRTKSALVVIPASGGARMQEGVVSLMQMPRSIVAVQMVREAKLPYIVVLTNPTTGGVSASFAMLGDIHVSEPGAMIGFAGKRVIEETIREQLPADFQTAEYLFDHGMVDLVAHRKDLKDTLARLIGLLMNASDAAHKLGDGKDRSSTANSNGKTATVEAKKAAGSKMSAKTKPIIAEAVDLPLAANEEVAPAKVARAKK